MTVAVVAPQAASASTFTQTFATRGCSAWSVPSGVSVLTISASGEAGSGSSPFAAGGAGDIVTGTVSGLPGTATGHATLNVCVGVNGGQAGPGNGGFFGPVPGGGASGVTVANGPFQSAVIIAGGGGGGTSFRGGSAGLPVAGNGVGSQGGLGGNNSAPGGGAGGAGAPGYGAGAPGGGSSPFTVFAAGGQGGSGASGGGAGYRGGGGGGGGSTGGPGGGGTDFCDSGYVSGCSVLSGGSYQAGVSTDPANAHVTITYQGPSAPSVSISSPADGQTYDAGQVVTTAFACVEGDSGPGLSSCTDSGDGQLRTTGSLDTSTPGTHTYIVVATSLDGLSAQASITYTVRDTVVTVHVTGSQTYGSATPAFGYTASSRDGVVVSGTVTCDRLTSGPITPAVPAGVTDLDPTSCSGLSLSGPNSPGLTITYAAAPGSFAVAAAPLTITATTSVRQVYGGPVVPVFPSYSGFVNSESSAALTTAPTCTGLPASTPVGSYQTGANCSGASAANYTISYVAGVVNVDPAPLRLTPDDQTIPFGSADPAFTYQVDGLVPGDSLTSTPTCSVTGAHTKVGTYRIACAGASAGSNYVLDQSATGTLTVTLSVSTAGVGSALIDQPYNGKLAAAGGTGTLTWTVAAGTLPAGLTLAKSGSITGTPTVAGTFPVTVRVTDSATSPNTVAAQVTVVVDPMTIATLQVPAGLVGKAYSTQLARSGGKGANTWTLATGSTLPTGLKLTSAGAITGTPQAAGTTTFTVTVTDSASPKNTATRQLTIVIAPMTITTSSIRPATAKQYYSVTLTHSGGVGSLHYAVTGGSLPAGLKLSASGAITGTPQVVGTYTFTVQLTDSAKPTQNVATATYTLRVN